MQRAARGPAAIAGFVARRPTLAAALIYALLALVMFGPGLIPGRTLSASDYLWTATPWEASRPADIPALGSNQEQADAATQFQPSLQATRAALPDVPLWDPYILSGRPFLGDPQSAVFSVFSAPAYLLPFWKSLAVIAALKLFVAALGAFLLARAIGMRFGGALLTGLVFGFSLWSVTWQSWPHMSVWAFLPWLCLLSERLLRRPEPLAFAGLAAVVGLALLSGHPASSYQILFAVWLFWIVRVVASRGLRRGLVRRLLAFAAALAVGAALAAVALIPFAELLAHSSDATARADTSDLLHQPARYLLGLFLFDYWGHGRTSLQFGPGLEERAYYVGALALVLAAVALVMRRRVERIALAGVGAAALAVSTGLAPLYDLVVAFPGFDAANNGRFAVIAVLCLAVLAGWGLDELADRRVGARRRRRIFALAVGLALVPVAVVIARGELNLDVLGEGLRVAWAFATPGSDSREAVIRLAALVEWLVLAAAALVLVYLRLRRRLSATAFVALAMLLAAADLFKAGVGYNPAIPLDHAEPPVTPAIRFLQDQRPARFAALEARAPISLAYPLPPNVATRFRVHDVRGYVIPTEERYFEIWRRVIAPSRDCYYVFCTQAAPAEPRALAALGLLGVSYLLQDRDDPPLPRLRAGYAGPDARIYENPRALPRAFLVDRQLVAGSADAALAATTAPGFPARTLAVTERRLPGLRDGAEASDGSPGQARITVYDRERLAIESRARRSALLVVTDNWYPGWKATVDGEEVPIHRVDYVIRGVRVPAGDHRVELSYEPASWRAGWILSGGAAVVIATAAGVGWRRRRRVRGQDRPHAGMFEA